ncbi:MAG TPA: SLBB domain-containing protein, partial [Phnomibacter sp.]|nr:SLBB domain-containing protein [Phnomibacter sp.]
MRLTRLFLFLCLIFAGAGAVLGQSALGSGDMKNVDVDKLSDAEIRAYYNRAAESGLSEGQLFELAKTRGLSDLQATKLKERILMLGLTMPEKKGSATGRDEGAGEDSLSLERAIRTFDEKLGKVETQKLSYDPRIFGSELFAETSTTFVPNLRIATPANYILGPDDEVIINVFGYSEKTYRERVNAEGEIYIENVGPIMVNGLTVEDAEAKIRTRLGNTIYRAMKTGATKMNLQLGNIRSLRITIIGQAKKPGTYTVSSLTTLFNALYLCGGPNDMGSYRNIELIRGNKVVRTIDLYRFLGAGDRTDNVLLQEQDVIRIPYYQERMIFDGYVKRPGIYEIRSGESFERLFSFAGGFSDSAYRRSVTIYQITDDRLAIKTLLSEDFSKYQPQTADSV